MKFVQCIISLRIALAAWSWCRHLTSWQWCCFHSVRMLLFRRSKCGWVKIKALFDVPHNHSRDDRCTALNFVLTNSQSTGKYTNITRREYKFIVPLRYNLSVCLLTARGKWKCLFTFLHKSKHGVDIVEICRKTLLRIGAAENKVIRQSLCILRVFSVFAPHRINAVTNTNPDPTRNPIANPNSKVNPFSTWRLHVAWMYMVSVHTSST